MKQLLLLSSTLLLLTIAGKSQFNLSASFGLSNEIKPTGQGLVAYNIKNTQLQAGVQRTGVNGATIGGNVAYDIEKKGITLSPYLGFWYKGGAKSNIDHYKDQIILTNVSRRLSYGSWGLQVVSEYLFVDAGFVGKNGRINVGLRYKFE